MWKGCWEMETKERILLLLEQNRDKALSGQSLAESCGVSRAAVWKAVEALRQEGHRIQAATNRGYRLAADSDILCRETVLPHVQSQISALLVPPEAPSTNTIAKELALQGAPGGTVVLTGKQTGGRGRRGRAFESPEGGIYLSLLIRPQLPAEEGVRLTLAACVGVCRAMAALCGKEGQIKWVNDVYYAGKKVCGILTEGATSLENGLLDYAVVGVGLNYRWPEGGFSPELAAIAGSLYGPGSQPPFSRNSMAAALIDQLMDCLSRPLDPSIMAEYRARSMVAGKAIQVLRGEGSRPALAKAILEDGRLLVQYEDDGAEEALCSGEVSIRPLRP